MHKKLAVKLNEIVIEMYKKLLLHEVLFSKFLSFSNGQLFIEERNGWREASPAVALPIKHLVFSGQA